ncbi:MAG: 2-oxoglutarate dehydrogenase, E2 component, dihydrolipoamide succinyltransferase [Bacteroidetes bacterium]|nr:2-oxoglutarate dehydrogenase, E2 component, dihydrolipoamide succinyltransferase [Bacteroidota bacterium]
MEIVMPKMGESVTEGTIIKWYKNVGDTIELDEIIFEISTDKVDTEVPSPIKGTLSSIKVPEGDTVDVGTVVATIDGNGSLEIDTNEGKDISEEKLNASTLQVESITSEVESKRSGNVIEIAMPKMGESVMEGTIIKWFKKVGDTVNKDETIFEISTDKVDTEIPSPVDGTVTEILVAEQETVEVGTIVAKISSTNEPEVKNSQPKETIKTVKDAQPEPQTMHKVIADNTVNTTSIKRERGKRSTFFSPLVLNISRKENISFDELNNIQGTGLNSRVTKKDILKYIEKRITGTAETQSKLVGRKSVFFQGSEQPVKFKAGTSVTRIPMDNIRQKIMQHMINSRDTSVHVTAMLEVDIIKIYNFIKKNKERILNENSIKLTYMAFIADACVKALKTYPLVNSTIEGSTILQKNFVNLGIAIALEPNGLIVPNIKGAEQRNILGLAKAINDLAFNARSKKLSHDDITNGTFTITNYGVFGTIFGTPIINQPEVAILGVGTVVKKPAVIEVDGSDVIAIRPTMTLTLSHDHRLVDGMLGGQFLKYLKDTLESFNENMF